MRSRERLISVLRTVNGEAPGILHWQANYLHSAALMIEAGASLLTTTRQELAIMSSTHSSPHIRELAKEALHYGTAQ